MKPTITVLSEGLRVILTKNWHTIFRNPGHHRLQENQMHLVPAGAKGTVYAFRVRDGLPTHGLPHPRMWGVVFDEYPEGLSGHNGVCVVGYDYTRGELVPTGETLPPETLSLLTSWLALEERLNELHKQMTRMYAAQPEGKYVLDDRTVYDAHRKLKDETEQARKLYDHAARIPQRNY